MLFQSVVLPCQYNSVSTQTPVVQWVYKSYCRDRTRDSFNFPDSMSGGQGGGGLTGGTRGTGGLYETGMTASYLDCADSSRTVRTVASISGSSITLSEYYKSRDISIINSKTSVVLCRAASGSVSVMSKKYFPFKSHSSFVARPPHLFCFCLEVLLRIIEAKYSRHGTAETAAGFDYLNVLSEAEKLSKKQI